MDKAAASVFRVDGEEEFAEGMAALRINLKF
jgi:hypothetical protein